MKSVKNILTGILDGIHPRQIFKFWTRRMDRAMTSLRYESKNGKGTATVVMIVAMLASLVSTGIAIGSFFSLILSLLTLYFIFTKLFGIRLNLDDFVEV